MFFAVRSDCAFSCRPGQATSSRAAATNQPARTTQTTTTLTHDTLTYLLPSSSFCPPSPVLHLPSVSCPAGRDLLVPARVYKPLHLPIVSRLQHIHGLEPRDGRWVAETIDQSNKIRRKKSTTTQTKTCQQWSAISNRATTTVRHEQQSFLARRARRGRGVPTKREMSTDGWALGEEGIVPLVDDADAWGKSAGSGGGRVLGAHEDAFLVFHRSYR